MAEHDVDDPLHAADGPDGPVEHGPKLLADEPDVGDEPTEPVAASSQSWKDRARTLTRSGAARAVEIAKDERTRKTAKWVAGTMLTATVAAVEQRARAARSVDPKLVGAALDDLRGIAASLNGAPTEEKEAGFPTPRSELHLNRSNSFFSFGHPFIPELRVGVEPTQGISAGFKVLISWETYLPSSRFIEFSDLSDAWTRPIDMQPQIPLELRRLGPGKVGFRFLAPGELATGVTNNQVQVAPKPPNAAQVSIALDANHAPLSKIINQPHA